MRHRSQSKRLGVKTAHRKAMLRNMSISLVEHGRIKTTHTRAKVLRPYLEKIVTKLKDPSLAQLRYAYKTLADRPTVMKIAQEVAPVMKDRPGGYLRILKLSAPRVGDAADMALIEWVEPGLVNFYKEQEEKKAAVKKQASAKKKSTSKKSTSSKSAPKASKSAKK